MTKHRGRWTSEGNGTLMNFRRVLYVVTIIMIAVLSPAPSYVNGKDQGDPKAASSVPRLVDVGADKCIPCIMMAPVLAELKKEYAGVLNVEFVDAWKNPNEERKYNVRGIPTQIFYSASGREVGRHMGFISKEEIVNKFEELKIPLKKTENRN